MTKPVISTPIPRKHPFSPLKMSRMAANGFMLKIWFMLRKLGGLGDEVRHGQKMKKFLKKISKILIVNISASVPSI